MASEVKNINHNESELESLFQQLTGAFQKAMSEVKLGKTPDSVINDLFRKWMKTYQNLIKMYKQLSKAEEKHKNMIEHLEEDKKRLEYLYTTGLQFSSDMALNDLLENAIETVVKALRADAGFIVLLDEKGNEELLSYRNMDPEGEERPRKLSRSVIEKAISSNLPYVMNTNNDDKIKEALSIINLGISSAICVPLIQDKNVLGAVYLDRRKQKIDFEDGDLVFLMSFARQITKGIGISKEIINLEGRLISAAVISEEEIRKDFPAKKIIGSNHLLMVVLRMACKIAPTMAPVIILGENGTGKELLARAIHKNSRKKDGPFVAINCSAIPKDLLESELFGYEKGAFTGATKEKTGKIETANGGTILFDEIGEMSIDLQAKLLRVVQFQELERLGSVKPVKLDVRFMASTNRDLKTLIKEGLFREDLYYRLKVVELVLPALRNRIDDIQELTHFFIEKHRSGDSPVEIDSEALSALESYTWPGNVRELENVIQRALVFANDNLIKLGDLPKEIYEGGGSDLNMDANKTLAEMEDEFRRKYIRKILKKTSSKSEAANILGINRTHLHRIIKQLGIE